MPLTCKDLEREWSDFMKKGAVIIYTIAEEKSPPKLRVFLCLASLQFYQMLPSPDKLSSRLSSQLSLPDKLSCHQQASSKCL